MEGLKESNAKLVVYVHPSKVNNVYQAVLRQLSNSLFTFDEVFDGILLAYSFEIQNKTPKILPGLIPYLGVNIDAKLLVLSPKAGMLLEGKVAKLGKESIHVVILGVCAAAITSENIREDLVYKIKDGSGVYVSKTDRRHVIKMGTMLRFLVKGLDEEILHVFGSLIPENTGSINWLSSHDTIV